jgi:3-hydroxy-9,10-secoandrosta-1,3,5(10)-triene-9,17-dione monooxygenase reductase component
VSSKTQASSDPTVPKRAAAASSAVEIDGALYRQVMGHFLTGVTVISAIDPENGEPVGLAASSFTSVSMDPALVLFCAATSSSTWPRIRASGAYCVNVLASDQERVSRQFSSKGDKYADVSWHAGSSGSPIFDEALAWIDCRIDAVHDAGDHVIVVGAVLDLGSRDAEGPLAYYRGGYGAFTR